MKITADTITLDMVEHVQTECLKAYQEARKLSLLVWLGNVSTEDAAAILQGILEPLQMEVKP
jgi:hypothetical protein